MAERATFPVSNSPCHFSVCRTSLSPAIQHECPGEIKAAVLQETLVQQEAYDYVHRNLGHKDLIMGEVFQPETTTGEREYEILVIDISGIFI